MTEQRRVPCVACLEPILAGARLCPHCRSPQRPEKVRVVGAALKWIGGITAMISLIIGSASVQQLYTGWRDKAAAVDELIAAAHIELASQDYEGGWSLLEQALALEPASQAARRFQIPFAMQWLRNIRVGSERKFSTVVDRLLPVLYRGAADPDPVAAADVYAHIGWANYLKQRDGDSLVRVETHYRRALALDPGNPYAHAHWGHWLLVGQRGRDPGGQRLEAALGHFQAALAAGRARDYVADVALYALLSTPDPAAEAAALELADDFRRAGRDLPDGHFARLAAVFQPIANRIGSRARETLARLLGHMPAADLAALYGWIADNEKTAVGITLIERRYIRGRLAEAAGDRDGARALYRSLAADPQTGRQFRDRVLLPAIDRTGG